MSTGQIFEWEGITQPSYWGGQAITDTGHRAMDQIAATGASTLTLVPNFFQTDQFSSTVRLKLDPNNPWGSESDTLAQVKQSILDARARGLNVVLKPHVETENRVWRAEIAPADPKAWFASYKAMMVEYAKVAREAGAEMICVGTEMKSMTDPTKVCSDGKTYTQKWAEIIDAVRTVYSGKVTYAATYDEVVQVGFWDKVDYIGVDAYIPSSTVDDPPVDQIVDAWIQPHFNPWVRDTLYGGKSVVDYYKSLSERYGKKVVFTEVGYRSMDGANKDPGVFGGSGEVDLQEQVDCYTALFEVMENHGGQWLAGSLIWSYYSFENPMEERGVEWTDYTTQWKPANDTITFHYSSPAHLAGLVRNGTAAADKLDGGYHNDTLYGGGGNDALWGGAGTDRMEGGAGDDIYTVDDAGDQVIEVAGEGNDTIVVSSSASLAGFLNVENLVAAGTGAIALTGNGAANVLKGNSAASTLSGGGGSDILDGGIGADRLVGGAENDLYYVDNARDVVVEIAGGGTADRVYTSASYTLAVNVERLSAIGSASIALTGNSRANTITGNAGHNKISGGSGNDVLSGGAGNDTIDGGYGRDVLSGGAGRDTFVFSVTPKSSNFDKVRDYNVTHDSIQLDNKGMTKLGSVGRLGSSKFVSGTKAVNADDCIIYDRSTGNLFYDADGSGKGAQVLIAQFANKAALRYNEFYVI
jgi:Ca2+-binding RTX toxin-like protein